MRSTLPAGLRRRAPTLLGLAALLVAAGFSSGCRIEIEPEEDTSLEPTARVMLARSAAAWNRGDLDAFLEHYQDVAATTYVGPDAVLSGTEAIRELYAPLFAPGATRDSLRYDSIRVRSLSPLIGVVTARWDLLRGGAVARSGPATFVMRRTGTGWKITHDHSSSDPASMRE